MKNFSISLSVLVLSASLVYSYEIEGQNVVASPRFLEGSSSGSGSGSCAAGPGALAVLGAVDSLDAVIVALTALAASFSFLASIVALLEGIVESIGGTLLEATGCSARRKKRELKSYKYMDPELVAGVQDALMGLYDAIDALIEARSDPAIGDAFDADICSLADAAAELEAVLGGRRRALKSKSGKAGGIICEYAGKSAKTYSPSPTATAALTYKAKSGKGYYYATVTPEPSETVEPTEAVYYTYYPKGGKRARNLQKSDQ